MVRLPCCAGDDGNLAKLNLVVYKFLTEGRDVERMCDLEDSPAVLIGSAKLFPRFVTRTI
jgi:hypothetical protein